MSQGRIATDGGQNLGQNPFASLSGAGLPVAPAGQVGGAGAAKPTRAAAPAPVAERNRGRVDIRRETGGRGGKTVSVGDGVVGGGLPEKELLAKRMRAACGCGGTVKDGAIEIQGDQRETVARLLREAGFRPVMAGG